MDVPSTIVTTLSRKISFWFMEASRSSRRGNSFRLTNTATTEKTSALNSTPPIFGTYSPPREKAPLMPTSMFMLVRSSRLTVSRKGTRTARPPLITR